VKFKFGAALTAAVFALTASMSSAATFDLAANLSASNQNGSDPAIVSDPLGVVPTTATGSFFATLDDVANTLDFSLVVDGITRDQLFGFGPNSTSIHLHRAAGGIAGNFGPVVVDLTFGAVDADFTETGTGFTLARSDLSILEADQGAVANIDGFHPGDDNIVSELTSGSAFVLVHSNKDIFLSTSGPVPGFPFGEIRGTVAPVPLPASGIFLLGGVDLLMRRRKN
jgi:hypothetical protein